MHRPEHASNQGFAFAPNVTPVSFNTDPSESIFLSDPPSTPSSHRRPTHNKKRPDNHVPRPPNAFILFRSSFIKSQHVSTDVETNHSTLSKIIGLTWQNLPHNERQIWHMKAKHALDEHKRKFPKYTFRPSHQRGSKAPEKRKVREVCPKDIKRCEKIAELLVEGVKGQDLEAAIHEFDRHHVPEIVTRFEKPITARSFRRSSSAPAPDTVHSRDSFLSPKSSRVRASSSDPTRQSSPTPSEPASSSSQTTTQSEFYEPSYPLACPLPMAYSFPPRGDAHNFDQGVTAPAPSCSQTSVQAQEQQDWFDGCRQPRLSINTSSVFDWTTTHRPYSYAESLPPTPSSYSGVQSPLTDGGGGGMPQTPHDPFATFANLAQFDLTPFQLDDPSTFAAAPPSQNYADVPQPPPPSSSCYDMHPVSPFDFVSMHKSEMSKMSAAHLDPEFSAFMASLYATGDTTRSEQGVFM